MPRAKRETRASESRDATRNRMPQTRGVGNLFIPADIVKQFKAKGLVLRWIAETVEGAPRAVNVQNRLINGWQAVMAEECPMLATPVLPGQPAEQLIRRGGQILVKQPIKDWQAERRAIEAENARDLQSVNWDASLKPEERSAAPGFDNKVTIERVVTAGDPQFKE